MSCETCAARAELCREGLGLAEMLMIFPKTWSTAEQNWPWFRSSATSQHSPGMDKTGTTLELPQML